MSAETFRAREVYKYYQPRGSQDILPPLKVSPKHHQYSADHIPTITNFTTQQSFSDTALTAFAQLIALRLQSQRAIVSLIDHENEYFLAESTSTLSLIDDDGLQNAWLSISGARVPRSASLCEQTLRLAPNQDSAAEMTPVFLVPDLRLDEHLNQLDCVKGAPYLRFYCGVPLTNNTGTNIGCVYVVDDRPRTDFTLEQAQFLTKMAATVMDHLENTRAREDIVRVTMMSQALHAFIEGDGTMVGDWQRLKKYNLPAGAGIGFSWESNKNDGVDSYFSRKETTSVTVKPLPGLGVPSPTSSAQSPLQYPGNNTDARFNFNNSPWSSSSEIPQVPYLKSVFERFDEAGLLDGGRDTEFANKGFSNLLHTTFSRASNLVREGMEVDGAVFFDAPFNFYQGRSTLETDPRAFEEKSSDSSSDSDSDDLQRPGPRPQVLQSTHHHSRGASLPKNEGLKSEILGFSTRETSSWDNQVMGPDTKFAAIDQSLLTSLVRRYPRGELFVFDHDGPIWSETENPTPEGSQTTIISVAVGEKRARQRARKRAEILRLLVAFPKARQIFFVPLYDSTSGCFIGSFAWSTSATRIFTIENHLSYLVAFGHSVMSEVSRLNTMSADRAKGDFISNVSHELRSPLHGILASVEFLADTVLDGFQQNLVDTVDICGRTLLDTIEHVLDFSKIKKFGQESAQSMGVVADLDVSAVIEEVLQGVFAGFEFNGLSSQGLADTTRSRSRRDINDDNVMTKELRYGDLLTVILEMDFRDQWKFPTVPGTWRRLTMNLFGNSLKYTRNGFIKVKLQARTIPANSNVKSDGIERTMVTLSIADSGQGMSSEFMKTKLFMPFSQEDVTAPGTGLGMSIVKQIVDLSGGTIDIRSELGKGTEIKLSLPLENCSRTAIPSSISSEPGSNIESVRHRARGRTVTICGFDNITDKSDLQISAAASLKASVEKYVTEWFNLKIVSNGEAADIIISDESAFLDSAQSSGGSSSCILILCSSAARRDIYTAHFEPSQLIEFVSKPCGPHRLAKALLNCLDTEDALKSTNGMEVDNNMVSASQNRAIPKRVKRGDARTTAVNSSSINGNQRLIGQLQSSIGFAPSSVNVTVPMETIGRPPVQKAPTTNRTGNSLPVTMNGDGSGTVREESPASSGTTNADDTSRSTSAEKSEELNKLEEEKMRPMMLLVEDNPVNMMLLATYMKKKGWDYEQATNGLLALEAFQRRPQGFDVIFMDVSMPVMTGYESTRGIRLVESARRSLYDQQQQSLLSPVTPSLTLTPNSPAPSSPHFPFNDTSPTLIPYTDSDSDAIHMAIMLNGAELSEGSQEEERAVKVRPSLIIALTGFSSQKDQEMAFEAGVDVFMTKPVRFREVGKILEGWVRSRQKERQDEMKNVKVDGLVGKLKVESKEKRDEDEDSEGGKRSG